MQAATEPGRDSGTACTEQDTTAPASEPGHSRVSAGQPVEVEAKFTTLDSSLLHRLAGRNASVNGYRFGAPVTRHICDTYLDTPDRRLLRHGYHLRARSGGGHWLATLKSSRVIGDSAIFQRMELEAPLLEGRCPSYAADLPDIIATELARLIDPTEPLIVLCVLEQARTVRAVLPARASGKHGSGTALAAMSLDEVGVRRCVDGEVVARFYEIELELSNGLEPAALQPLAAQFMAVYKLAPSRENKLIRSLAVLGRHPVASPAGWEGVHPHMHMGDACRAIWHDQFTKMLLNEAGIRYGSDTEFVHNARVALRRCRAAATLYGRFFRKQAIRKQLKQLRRTARLLGAVRDLDVAIDRLEEYQKNHQDASGSLRVAQARWAARRDAARQELLAWLDSPKYANFVAGFVGFCESPGQGIADATLQPGEEVTPTEVRHVAPAMLAANFEAVRAYESWFERSEAVPAETLHRLRIECKYLRYNLEFVSHLLGKDGDEIVSLLRKLQDDLGSINDAVVSRQLLADEMDSKDHLSIASYTKAQEKIIAKLGRRVRDDFASFVAKENRRRFFHAIANV